MPITSLIIRGLGAAARIILRGLGLAGEEEVVGEVKPVARVGDRSDHGGTLLVAGACTETTVNSLLVAKDQIMHACPIDDHGVTPVTATSTKTLFERDFVVRVGDKAGCGATIEQGSPDTFAG